MHSKTPLRQANGSSFEDVLNLACQLAEHVEAENLRFRGRNLRSVILNLVQLRIFFWRFSPRSGPIRLCRYIGQYVTIMNDLRDFNAY